MGVGMTGNGGVGFWKQGLTGLQVSLLQRWGRVHLGQECHGVFEGRKVFWPRRKREIDSGTQVEMLATGRRRVWRHPVVQTARPN